MGVAVCVQGLLGGSGGLCTGLAGWEWRFVYRACWVGVEVCVQGLLLIYNRIIVQPINDEITLVVI